MPPTQPQDHEPPILPRVVCHSLGLGLLLANKIRRTIRPYDRPRPWSSRDIDRSIAYDFDVVRNWEGGFRDAGLGDWIRGRHVLELGPGPDLGTGLILLARGAASYTAIDRFPLATGASDRFYETLLTRLEGEPAAVSAAEAYQLFMSEPDRGPLRYLLAGGNRMPILAGRGPFDLWLSQAALEHVADPHDLIAELTPAFSPGAIALHHVDAATHTPWIRDRDPLNILRFPERIYRALSFPGSPNRWRASSYVSALGAEGWDLVDLQPIHRLTGAALAAVRPGLDERFRSLPDDELAVFSFRLILRRGVG